MIPQRNHLQRALAQNIAISIVVSLFVWFALLISGARAASAQQTSAPYHVKVGPIILDTLTKQKLPSGETTATLSFENGLFWFFAACTSAAITYTFARAHNSTINKKL